MDVPEDMDVSGQPASGANNKLLLAGGGVASVGCHCSNAYLQ